MCRNNKNLYIRFGYGLKNRQYLCFMHLNYFVFAYMFLLLLLFERLRPAGKLRSPLRLYEKLDESNAALNIPK